MPAPARGGFARARTRRPRAAHHARAYDRGAMFRLSRDVRFAVDLMTDEPRAVAGRNGHAGKPPVTGVGQCYYSLAVTVAGRPDEATGYLVNIRQIDEAVRHRVIPLAKSAVRAQCRGEHRGGGGLVLACFDALRDAFGPHALDAVELHLSPHTSLCATAALQRRRERPMILLHHTFEFAASHRLHNPSLSEAQNRAVFGKCNNPHGHGHNYVLRVTLRGEPDKSGLLMKMQELERVVDELVIEPFDHKHLNLEVDEFATLNPSVENIAMVIFRKLKEPLTGGRTWLDSVTVWETPKTWCEYREAGD